jgi:hypothetical protein
MSEQGTTKDLSTQAENELICEEVLHWKPTQRGWLKNDGYMYGGCGTPAFTTWAEVGLILDTLAARWPDSRVILRALGGSMVLGGLTPSEIRDAALEFLRSRHE